MNSVNKEKGMLESEIKQDLNSNYLVIKSSLESGKRSFKERMIQNNNIVGVLPFEVRMEDANTYYYFDLMNKREFKTYYGDVLFRYKNISYIIQQILNIIQEGTKYLLSANDFVVHPEYIYVDNVDSSIKLCYMSGYDENFFQQLHKLLEFFLGHIDYGDEKAVAVTYQLYQLTNQDTCNIDLIMGVIQRSNQGNKNTIKERVKFEKEDICQKNSLTEEQMVSSIEKKKDDIKDISQRSQGLKNNNQEGMKGSVSSYILVGIIVIVSMCIFALLVAKGVLNNNIGYDLDYIKVSSVLFLFTVADVYIGMRIFDIEKRNECKGKQVKEENQYTKENHIEEKTFVTGKLQFENYEEDIDFSETTLLCEEEQDFTVVLNEPETVTVMLIDQSKEYHENILINKFPFVIGKIKEQVDYHLPYVTISRLHAEISCDNQGNIFIQDLNSKNGTYINGRRLTENQKIQLRSRDNIMFANKSYVIQF